MDYKRNKHFFTPGYSRKLNVLTVCGGVLALLGLFVWWYIWYRIYIFLIALAGIATVIGALSIRPKAKDVADQIETARKAFTDTTAEKLKYPDDFEENSLAVWGFCEGTTEKILKNGETYTDRVAFALLYLKKSTLYVRTEVVSLLHEEASTADYSLPLSDMKISIDEASPALIIASTDESLILPVQAIDYSIEQFMEKLERQIKKCV